MFVGLFLSQSGLHLGLDRRLTALLGRWGWHAHRTIDVDAVAVGHPLISSGGFHA